MAQQMQRKEVRNYSQAALFTLGLGETLTLRYCFAQDLQLSCFEGLLDEAQVPSSLPCSLHTLWTQQHGLPIQMERQAFVCCPYVLCLCVMCIWAL